MQHILLLSSSRAGSEDYLQHAIPMIEEHLGGHSGVTNIDPPVLLYLKDRFNLKSMVDIGCGPGGMQKVAKSLGMSFICLTNGYRRIMLMLFLY